MLLAAILLIPFFLNQKVSTVSAAAPAFTSKRVTITGVGDTHQLSIINKVAGSKYKWSSSDNAVATVTSKGLITSVSKGEAVIRCKITYPSKKTKTLTCNVKVYIPATDISITNATLVNGAYQLALGSKADLDALISPENSSETAYWYVEQDNGDASCITLDDASKGIITGVKEGKAVLRVKATKSATRKAADLSDIDASVIVEVMIPTATVNSADITGNNTIKVVFDSPIQKSTVIGAANDLLNSITITALKNTKGVLASDPGALTASLSDDLKTLTITTAKDMDGSYRIAFTKKILTSENVALEEYEKTITYIDADPPCITSAVPDDSGMIFRINFNKPINKTGLKVSYTPPSSTYVNSLTASILNTSSNYVLSQDSKTLLINLSGIATTDYGKSFFIQLYGIKDLNGNTPATSYLTATIYADASKKSQAQLITVTRTSYYTLTATFSRSIQFGGYLSVENGGMLLGAVDAEDNKKVNYTMLGGEASYTGMKTVSVSGWNSYNVIDTDTTGKTPVSRTVNFTVDSTPPTLTSNAYDAASGILTMTFSEKVKLNLTNGIFSANTTTLTGGAGGSRSITYSMVSHADGDNIIKLQMSGLDAIGYYTFNIGVGLVTDDYNNNNVDASITINNLSNTTELPGPYAIQPAGNPNQITLLFANMLDVASAQTVSNYSISGVNIISAVVSSNTPNGASVVLTVMDGSVDSSVERILKISGVRGYNGSFTAIGSFSMSVTLTDNKKPYYIAPPVFDTSSKSVVKLNFSETITGTLTVEVYQLSGATTTQLTGTVTINGNMAYINLGTIPPKGTWLKIVVTGNNLTDTSGNAVVFSTTTLGVAATY
jgi:hypothetical protein